MDSDSKQALSKLDSYVDDINYVLRVGEFAVIENTSYRRIDNQWVQDGSVEYVITKAGLSSKNINESLTSLIRENKGLKKENESKF